MVDFSIHEMTNSRCLYFLAHSAKGIDGVTIKDPKLVELVASLLEVGWKTRNRFVKNFIL